MGDGDDMLKRQKLERTSTSGRIPSSPARRLRKLTHVFSLPLISLLATIVMPSSSFAQVCTSPNGDLGVIVYNRDLGVFQGCTPGGWAAFHTPACVDDCDGAPPPPTGCPNVGNPCSDGSFYIGTIGADRIYSTTVAHEGFGPWNDGNNNGVNHLAVGTTLADGAANTAAAAAADASSVAGTQQNYAAVYCTQLTAHGRDDWYLPSYNEIQLFWQGGARVLADLNNNPGSAPWGNYWSSTEHDTYPANYGRTREFINSGTESAFDKFYDLYIRCIRK